MTMAVGSVGCVCDIIEWLQQGHGSGVNNGSLMVGNSISQLLGQTITEVETLCLPHPICHQFSFRARGFFVFFGLPGKQSEVHNDNLTVGTWSLLTKSLLFFPKQAWPYGVLTLFG